jgi:hypothetical protein
MENKYKRSGLLCTILGDGCLHLAGPRQAHNYAYISIKHGWKQKDYVEYKAKLLSLLMDREVNVRGTKSYVKALDKTYDQYVISVGWKRLRAWRKFCYLNNIKRFSRILPFIKHPVLATALWFMDDGTVGTGPACRSDKTNKERICSGFVLYLGECFKEDAYEALYWFERNFKVKPKLRWQDVKYKGTIRTYPELRFTVADSLYIWKNIRHIVMEIPSMQHKFRRLEDRYNRADLAQPQTLAIEDLASEEIVHKLRSK